MTVELPAFSTGQINEVEPTPAEKFSGWSLGDAPPAAYLNWIHGRTYRGMKQLVDLLAIQQGNALATQESVGEVVSGTPTSAAVRALLYDHVDRILIASVHLDAGSGDDAVIATSEDDGVSFANRYTGTESGSGISTRGVVSPGNWAIVNNASFNYHYYAATPYTAWSQVTGVFGALDQVRGSAVAIVEGTQQVLIAVGGATARIVLAPVASAPTSGDFTSVDISSVGGGVGDLGGVATNGSVNVVGALATDGGFSPAILWSNVSGGDAAVDWTLVTLPTGSGDPPYVAHNGQVFVAVVSSGEVYVSADGASWDLVQTVGSASPSSMGIIADPETGFVCFRNSDGMRAARGAQPVFGLVLPDADCEMVRAMAFDPVEKRIFGNSSDAIERLVRSL